MIKSRLNSLNKKKENYDNTQFLLYPVLAEPPTISVGLMNSFRQYTYADYVADGEAVYYRLLPQTTTKIVMLEGTSFMLKPTVLDTSNLTDETNIENVVFNWSKGGSPLYEINALNNLKGTSSIYIQNAKRDTSGIYQLRVTNKYGETVSDELEIDVIDVNNHPFMYKNLLQNPDGSKGLDSWISDPDFTNAKLLNEGFKLEFASIPKYPLINPLKESVDRSSKQEISFYFSGKSNETNLKSFFDKIKSDNILENEYTKWRAKYYKSLLVANEHPGWNYGGFFPSPWHIDSANKNQSLFPLDQMLKISSTYFTRERIKFTKYGGKTNCAAYQDIDVSSIRNIVDGEAYGIDKVVAHFFAYVGIGITGYKTKYTNTNGDRITENMIPLSYDKYATSSFYFYDGQIVKPPMIPYIEPPITETLNDRQMDEIFNALTFKVVDQDNPEVAYPVYRVHDDDTNPIDDQDVLNRGPSFAKMGLASYKERIYRSGYWIGVLRNQNDTGYEKVNGYYRAWWVKGDGLNQTKDGRTIKKCKVEEWQIPNPPKKYDSEKSSYKRKFAPIKVNTTQPFEVEPVADDTTDIRLDFIDQDQNIIGTKTINGPTIKDIWAVKEKFWVPYTFANTYFWITNLTNQPITVFDKVYTTVDAVRGRDRVDINSSWLKKYWYRLFNNDERDNVFNTGLNCEEGASAMFGISADVVVPIKTRTIRVNIIFKHTSNTLFDANPRIKGWSQQEIYWDYLSTNDVDKRYVPYGNPRCGITTMHLSLHPNKVEISDKYQTYKIPPKNVWYLYKSKDASMNVNEYNTISNSPGGFTGNENTIDNLQYSYISVPSDDFGFRFESATEASVVLLENGQRSTDPSQQATYDDIINQSIADNFIPSGSSIPSTTVDLPADPDAPQTIEILETDDDGNLV